MNQAVAATTLAAAWLGSLAGLRLGRALTVESGRRLLVATAWFAVLTLVIVLVGAVRRGRAPAEEPIRSGESGRSVGRRFSRIALLALAVGAVATAGAAVRTAWVVGGPAVRVATSGGEHGVTVRAELLVVGDPIGGASRDHRVPARLVWLEPVQARPHLGLRPHDARVATRERVLMASSAGLGDVEVGHRLVITGLLREPDPGSRAWLRSLGIGTELDVVEARVRGDPTILWRGANHVRRRTAEAAHAALSPAPASLLTGLTTGELRGQPETVASNVDRSGLRHLVAVSGSNVALVVGAVAAVILGLGGSRRLAWWACLAAVWWLVLVVRAEPSVVRAALMATLVLVALIVGRARDPVNVLAVAGTVALLVDPLLAGRLGFALSMTATGGVLIIGTRVAEWLPEVIPRSVGLLIGATVGAQTAVAPLLLAIGSSLHPAALFANLIAVPAAAVGGLVGGGVAVVASVDIGAGRVVAHAARPALWLVLWAAEWFASPAGREMSVMLVAGVMVATGVVRVRRVIGRRDHSATAGRGAMHLGALATATVVVVVAAALPLRGSGLPSQPVLVALDVGQGDAILLGDPEAGWMLVDGGAEEARVVDLLRRRGVARLSRVVATHADSDHVGGLPAVLDAMPVGSLTVGPRAEDADRLLAAATEHEVPVHRVHASDVFTHGRFGVEVLSPPATGLGTQRNDNSLVLRIDGDAGTPAVLLPGDAEVVAQQVLLDRVEPDVLDVDVMVVPHHGGNTSDPAFLAATSPDVAIISAGRDNSFGHPHPAVLAQLSRAEVRRTDQDGDIVVPLGPQEQ
ncbi:ComEC/Rec2 family competence protein [Euzebya tangerina]|uniref:ComEC/Rec2 family competence protein n=1 Tax=Euzebya tangerina TaxID=591198 RepID=UPI000E31983D|nr:ComEC/Rec2 family competence protein [Euzebya tangerina]